MAIPEVQVGYQYYYSLVYMSQNNILEDAVYIVDYTDWVLSGIAYNTRAQQLSSRKVSMFGNLYNIIRSRGFQENSKFIEKSIIYFYEDILDVLSRHVIASHDVDLVRGRKRDPKPRTYPLVVPSFRKAPWIKQMFINKSCEFLYDGVNSHIFDKYRNINATFALEEESLTLELMCQLYDTIKDRKGVVLDYGY